MDSIILLIIALCTSTVGSICGVGGGVFMKPILDLTGIATVSVASFLSSMTVLAMTGYTTVKNTLSKGNSIEYSTTLPLGLGAALGGVVGKYLFEAAKSFLPDSGSVGAIQAVCLGIVAVGTMLYTLNKRRIKTKKLTSKPFTSLIGLFLGCMSSFLGIGGGPIDLVVLQYLFSMPTKVAVQNSLFVILLSQSFSLAYTLLSGTMPAFAPIALALMIAGGICGGIAGRSLSKKLSNELVDRLFVVLLLLIALISVYNFFKYI